MLTKTLIDSMAAAQTPEEAAQIFKRSVSVGLAKLFADALSETLANSKEALTAKEHAGWQDFIAGVGLELCWDRTDPLSRLPMIQTSSFAPCVNVSPKVAALGWEVGVSVRGSF